MMLDMRLVGDLPGWLQGQIGSGEKAVSGAMTRAATGLQRDWRSDIVASGLGSRLANAVRRRVYPEVKPSLNAAGLVYAQPNKDETASAAELIDAFNTGITIRGKRGLWLAVPIAKDVQMMRGPGNRRITPLGYEQRTGRRLQFVYRRGKPPLLVDQGEPIPRALADPVSFNRSRKRRAKAKMSKPIFILLPQVSLSRRLQLDPYADRWLSRIPADIVARWKGVRE